MRASDFQGRIQDFPERGANPRRGANLLFGILFVENCMKMKKKNNCIERGTREPTGSDQTLMYQGLNYHLGSSFMLVSSTFHVSIFISRDRVLCEKTDFETEFSVLM